MIEVNARYIVGCIVAPLVAPIVVLVILMITGKDIRDTFQYLDMNSFRHAFDLTWMFLLFGAPVAYLYMILLGLPFYYFVKKHHQITFKSITLGSALISVFPLLVMTANKGFDLYEGEEGSSIAFYLAFAIAGYLVGVTFWFLSGLNKKEAVQE